MKIAKLLNKNRLLLFSLIVWAFCFSEANAQSTQIDFPTPITAREIKGRIAARDIGDSRLTTYYYAFNGNQGDIFLKIQTSNLNGDIDVFYAEGMRPVTKISLYSDSSTQMTGREIYLRKPEKLILRVQGRTPNDDPALFSISFEGSFLPLTAAANANEPENPTIKSDVKGTVRVNSVGTILEPETKSEDTETFAETEKKKVKSSTTRITSGNDETESEEKLNRNRVVVTDSSSEEREAENPVRKTAPARRRTTARRTPPARTTTARKTPPAKTTAVASEAEELAKALENVRLVVLFKNGEKIERPMNDVLRFNIDKGTLTIISKRGAISRHSMLDISKVAIE